MVFKMIDPNVLEVFFAFIIVPYIVWVTTSIFNQRKELAVLKKILEHQEKRLEHIEMR